MNESRHLDSGNLQWPQAKGVLPPDNMVSKPMISRDYHLKPICAVATTSKTSPSHDSKFETTADQTTRYKRTTSILRNENVLTTPRQIKPDDEHATLKSHDRYRTGNTTPLHHQNEDTTIPRPPVPSLKHANVAITPRQINSHDKTASTTPRQIKQDDEHAPLKSHDRYRTGNSTPPPHHNSVTPDFRLNGVNDKRKPCETSPQTHHDPYLTCNTTPPPHHNSVTPDFRLNGVNNKRKPCSPRIHTQADFLGEIVRRAKLLPLSLMIIMELQMRIEQLQAMTVWSSPPPDRPPRQVNQRKTNINPWLISEGCQRFKRRVI